MGKDRFSPINFVCFVVVVVVIVVGEDVVKKFKHSCRIHHTHCTINSSQRTLQIYIYTQKDKMLEKNGSISVLCFKLLLLYRLAEVFGSFQWYTYVFKHQVIFEKEKGLN